MNESVCHACGQEAPARAKECPGCHAHLGTPQCPRCAQPVAQPVEQPTPFSGPAWNTDWQAVCVHCGNEFSSTTNISTGHVEPSQRLPQAAQGKFPRGQSNLRIVAGESVHMQYDLWDHQPTIEIEVRRQEAGNCGSPQHQLKTCESISLTVAECLELIRQLQGPLSPLLRRQAWWVDTT